MPQSIATLLFCFGILGLFWLDRDPKSRTSPALWVASIWILLACSRPPTRWLYLGQPVPIGDESLEGDPFNKLVYTSLIALAACILLYRRKRVTKVVSENWPVLLFFAYCLVSLAWSDFPGVGFRRWNKAIGDWMTVLIVWTDPRPMAAVKRLLARTAYVLVPLSVLFIRYYSDVGRYYHRWFGTTYFCGVAVEKNGLGALCLIAGLTAVWRLTNLYAEPDENDPGSRRRKFAQFVTLAMVLWLFSIVDSVTSLMCFLLASCLLIATRLRMFTRTRMMVHFFCAALVLLPASVAFLDFSPGALHAVGRNSTLTERTDIWAGVVDLTPNVLLGAGYESFWLGPRLDAMVANVTRWWVPNQSHNGYLETYANLGWLGVCGLALVLFYGYRRAVQQYRVSTAMNLMLAFFISGVVYNFTEAAFFRMTFPVWLILLLALNTGQIPREDSTLEPQPPETSEEYSNTAVHAHT